MSYFERFQKYMNENNDINENNKECDKSDIDVEINIIQRECEAEELINRENEISNKLNINLDTLEKVYDKIYETSCLIDILRKNGLNPLALKVINTNKLYTDIWRIILPSAESLQINSNNQEIANRIADTLEEKIKVANEGILDVFSGIKDAMVDLFDWIGDFFRSAEEKINRMADKVNGLDLNDEKLRMKMVKYWDLRSVKDYTEEAIDVITTTDEFVSDAKSGKINDQLGEKINAFINKSKMKAFKEEKKERPLIEVADDIIKGKEGEYFKSVYELNNVRKVYQVCFKKFNKLAEETKQIKRDQDPLDDIVENADYLIQGALIIVGASPITGMAVLGIVRLFKFFNTWLSKQIIRLMKEVVNNYLNLAKATYSCKA